MRSMGKIGEKMHFLSALSKGKSTDRNIGHIKTQLSYSECSWRIIKEIKQGKTLVFVTDDINKTVYIREWKRTQE